MGQLEPMAHDWTIANLVHQMGAWVTAGYLASLVLMEYQYGVRTNEAEVLLAKVGLSTPVLSIFLREGGGDQLARWLTAMVDYDQGWTVAHRLYLLGEWLRTRRSTERPQMFDLPLVAYAFQDPQYSPLQLSICERNCLSQLSIIGNGKEETPNDPIWALIEELERG